MAKAEIRNRVRGLRSEHDGMTQQQLADHCGCTRQTIIALEQGRYVPSLSLALRIAGVSCAGALPRHCNVRTHKMINPGLMTPGFLSDSHRRITQR